MSLKALPGPRYATSSAWFMTSLRADARRVQNAASTAFRLRVTPLMSVHEAEVDVQEGPLAGSAQEPRVQLQFNERDADEPAVFEHDVLRDIEFGSPTTSSTLSTVLVMPENQVESRRVSSS
ncbi:hypothetical protein BD413DRAFT_613156 [Trametes elegans]|nr:hypothetical protein BD413DRAFT_613156 [Trametes elegans]